MCCCCLPFLARRRALPNNSNPNPTPAARWIPTTLEAPYSASGPVVAVPADAPAYYGHGPRPGGGPFGRRGIGSRFGRPSWGRAAAAPGVGAMQLPEHHEQDPQWDGTSHHSSSVRGERRTSADSGITPLVKARTRSSKPTGLGDGEQAGQSLRGDPEAFGLRIERPRDSRLTHHSVPPPAYRERGSLK